MKKLLLLSFMVTILGLACAHAQVISGKVTGADDGAPLPGVNVSIKGTTKGTITDASGLFKLEVSSNDALIFSYIGYAAQEILVGSRTVIDVTLELDVTQMSEIVVTSLGIERDRKSLTYAVSELEGKTLAEARETNVANSLSGKIAGVQVSRTASGPSGSTRVIIRGNNVLSGNNQPLYVVDGVPIDNSNLQAATRWGGIDYGDGVSDLNPDDIESLTVLKGGSASALYGFRAANGAILVTTKKGSTKKGIGVEFNSNTTFERALITPEVQNVYGHGIGGNIPATQAEALNLGTAGNGTSWGARMQGQSAIFWDGTTAPYSPQPNNIKDFYRTGSTLTNTLVLSTGTERSDFRLSMSQMNNKSIVPTNKFNRRSFTFRGTSKITDRLSSDFKMSYVHTEAFNRTNMADIMDNPANGLLFIPRSVSLASLRDYKDADGLQRLYTTETFRLNPYFAVNENTNNDRKDRLFGFAMLKYQFTDWLSVQLRSGVDVFASDRSNRVVVGTRYRLAGSTHTHQFNVKETNTDFLVTVAKDINQDISFALNLGGNHLTTSQKQVGFDGFNLTIPNFYHISNAQNVTPVQNNSATEVNSFYGALNASFRNYLFVDASVRNDWFSTLSPGDVTALYSSFGLGLVFTEALNIDSEIFSFGKIRASYASIGNGAPNPFLNSLTFGVSNVNGFPTFGFLGSVDGQFVPTNGIPNTNLKPSTTTITELGTSLRFFNDRLSMDFAYYKSETVDQILRTTISRTSGFGSAAVTAGQVDNKGFEFLVQGALIQNSDLQLDLSFNFAKNENTVVSLAEGVNQFVLAQDRGVSITARPGEAYGLIEGFDYQRDANGNRMFGPNGLPLVTPETVVLGTATPDWTGGVGANLTYKGISFGTLIDIRQGGELFSISNRNSTIAGNSLASLEGRDAWYAGTGGLVGNGVGPDGRTNTVAVDPEVYWNTAPVITDASDPNAGTGSIRGHNIISDFVYDASYIKVREMSIGYTLPKSLIGTTFESVKISLVGRNLFFLKNNVPGIDPEANYNNGNAQGIESGTIPTTRSIGFNLNFRF